MAKGWALVTGASRGIGRALAGEAAAAGWNLVLSARSAAELEALAAELQARHGIATAVCPADLALPGAADALWQAALDAAGGRIGVLVNNAGLGRHGPFAGEAAGGWEREAEIVAVNVAAFTRLMWLAAAAMREAGGGRILNVASLAGFMPGPNFAVYHASKAYALFLSEAADTELRRAGVRVTALCPGVTATGFFDAAGVKRTRLMALLPVPGPESVARAGWRGFEAGRRVVVPGLMNRLFTFGPRLMPRRAMAALTAVLLARKA